MEDILTRDVLVEKINTPFFVEILGNVSNENITWWYNYNINDVFVAKKCEEEDFHIYLSKEMEDNGFSLYKDFYLCENEKYGHAVVLRRNCRRIKNV